MTPEERQLCQGLIITPTRGSRSLSKETFSRRFPSALENGIVATRLLEDGYETRNSDDVQCALIVGHTFGFTTGQVQILTRLLEVDWHVSHEDIVSALDELRRPESITALLRATQWIPEYLNYDDSRALAVKAIWALGNLSTSEAEAALRQLAASNEPVIRDAVQQQLDRRKG